MNLSFDHIIEMEHFSDADLVSIREAMQNDEQLNRAVRNWIKVSRHIGANIRAEFPAEQALVLFALRDMIDGSDLTEAEVDLARRSESQFQTSLQNHPSIGIIVARIADDAKEFERSWSLSFDSKEGNDEPKPNPKLRLHNRDAMPLRSRGMRLVRYAISTAAVVTLISLSILQLSKDNQTRPTQIATVTNELRTVTLNDGSTLRLAPSSTISWDGEFNRAVTLTGATYFDVVPSPTAFIVHTPSGTTTVLGTEFGVQTVDNGTNSAQQTIVTLVSGRVSLSLDDNDPSNDIILTPGKQGILTLTDISVSSVNLLDALAWSELIVFRDTPMKEVKEKLAKQFDVTIEMSHNLNETLLTGTFEQDRGIKEILDIVAAALGATVQIDSKSGVYSLSK